MKAILVREFGGPEVLTIGETRDPVPGPGEVLIRVHAAGVNPFDTYMRTGTYAVKPPLPYIPGADAAGVVEAVGAGVTDLAVGARVYSYGTRGGLIGSYAEKVVCPRGRVFPLADRVTFAQGAALGVPYTTAFRALFQRGTAKPGETVLTPFMGVGSEVYAAVGLGRRGVGAELKASYYRQAVKNVRAALTDGDEIAWTDAVLAAETVA